MQCTPPDVPANNRHPTANITRSLNISEQAYLEAVVLLVADHAGGQGVEGEEVGDAPAWPLHHVRVNHVLLRGRWREEGQGQGGVGGRRCGWEERLVRACTVWRSARNKRCACRAGVGGHQARASIGLQGPTPAASPCACLQAWPAPGRTASAALPPRPSRGRWHNPSGSRPAAR